MFMILLALFIIVPLAELFVIVEIGSQVGYFYTILTLVIISFTGAALAKRQGYATVARIQNDVGEGRMPGDSLIDGALILTAALLLLTPGYITDAVGLLILLPPVRALIRRFARRRIERAVRQRTLYLWTPGDGGGPGGPDSGRGPSDTGRGGASYSGSPPEPEQRRKELED